MRVTFEGLGFSTPTSVHLTPDDAFLLDGLHREQPWTWRLPWERLRLSVAGRNLSFLQTRLEQLGLQEGDRIQVGAKLLGGGGDGGSTGAESRDAFLKMYKLSKADKVDAHEERLARWTCCQLSGDRLTPPCVCDQLGTLFNKEAVIRALIEKTMPPSLAHISSMKHLISLRLTPKAAISNHPTASVKAATDYQRIGAGEVQFCCPVTDLEFSGAFRFSVHRKTGHVFSDRAIKDASKAVAEIVGAAPSPEDWLPLNGPPEALSRLKKDLISKRKRKFSTKRRPGHEQGGAESKKARPAVTYAPEEASKQIYASIFSTEDVTSHETFLCRSVGARGMNLT